MNKTRYQWPKHTANEQRTLPMIKTRCELIKHATNDKNTLRMNKTRYQWPKDNAKLPMIKTRCEALRTLRTFLSTVRLANFTVSPYERYSTVYSSILRTILYAHHCVCVNHNVPTNHRKTYWRKIIWITPLNLCAKNPTNFAAHCTPTPSALFLRMIQYTVVITPYE